MRHTHTLLSCCMILAALIFQGPASAQDDAIPAGRYALQLMLTDQPPAIPALPRLDAFRDKILYVVPYLTDGKPAGYALRLGFFSSAKELPAAKAALEKSFPGNWGLKVSNAERQAAPGNALTLPGAKSASARAKTPVPAVAATAPATIPSAAITATAPAKTLAKSAASPKAGATPDKGTDTSPASLMEQARQAVIQRDYVKAAALYDQVASAPENPFSQDALEFLGVVQERGGRARNAIATYEKYLKLYPKAAGVVRVQQRLTGLATAATPEQGKLKEVKTASAPRQWFTYGGFSQRYRRYSHTDDTGKAITNLSQLSTDWDLTARQHDQTRDMRTRFGGSYLYNFLSNGQRTDLRVNTLYTSATQRTIGLSGTFGRQSKNTGGVMGRFDGALAEYQVLTFAKLGLVTGYPADTSTLDKVNTRKFFYGVSLDLGTFANAYDLNLYAIEQKVDGMVDRRAVGGEFRNFTPQHSVFAVTDYDLLYTRFNIAMLIGSLTFENHTSINMLLDYRLSPLITTSNALQGQPEGTISALRNRLSDAQIRSLAADRTPSTRSVTMGVSRPLSATYQVSADATLTTMGGSPASGGLPEMPATGNQYYYSVQMLATDLPKPGSISVVGLRFSDSSTVLLRSASANVRYPITQSWFINPVMRVDFRHNTTDTSDQWTYAPLLRTEYTRKNTTLEAEITREWTRRASPVLNENTEDMFLTVGYRINF